MMISILIAVAVLAVVLLIIAGIKATPEKGGEDMIKNVYVYLVLFATLMMTIGGSVAVFMAAADMISPTAYYQSFEDYKRYGGMEKPNIEGQQEEKLSEEELLENYNAMVKAEEDRQIRRAQNSIIKSLGWIIIPLPVFIYFQRRLTKQ
jgi:hypothetical protein